MSLPHRRSHRRHHRRSTSIARCALLVALAAGAGVPAALAQDWPIYSRSPDRMPIAGAAPAIAAPRFVLNRDFNNQSFVPLGQSSPVVAAGRLYALGRSGGFWKMLVASAETGALLWQTSFTPALDSWSSPALDPANNAVYIPSGTFINAFDAATGTTRWMKPFDRAIVNASPLVTTDRGPADRLLITDFNGFGGGAPAELHCINVDPFNTPDNPFSPSQTVWSMPIGLASGASPAYSSGVVYVATIEGPSGEPGAILARSIAAPPGAPPLWLTPNPAGIGFFGGLTIADSPSGRAVYAASYSFSGGQLSANLLKLDAATGAVVWSIPSNRTSSIPIVLPGGFVALSTGIDGFGSVPSVQLFRDLGTTATRLWDTALDTWNDLNGNQQLDPGEFLRVGGWTVLPVAVPSPPAPAPVGPAYTLYTGVLRVGGGPTDPCTDLLALDLSRAPSDPLFARASFAGAGSTPAVRTTPGGPWLYTFGPAGVHAFGPVACYPNCDGSTATPALTPADFVCFLNRFRAGDAYANCDGSTGTPALTPADFVCFLSRFRQGCA